MGKQVCLDLQGDRLVALWRQLPERARQAALEELGRLIARAAQESSDKQGTQKP